MKPLDKIQTCGVCPEVEMPLTNDVNPTCKCKSPLFWTGTSCVTQQQCPCMVGYMQYEVGAHYETEECKECICMVGGSPKCKDKQCPKCAPGLRPIKDKTCKCVCEECPVGQRICPTSGQCIPADLWCNGIEDCSDDEVDCPVFKPPTKPTINELHREWRDFLILRSVTDPPLSLPRDQQDLP